MSRYLSLVILLLLIPPGAVAANNTNQSSDGDEFSSSYLENLKRALSDPVGVLEDAWDALTGYFDSIGKRIPYYKCKLSQFPKQMEQSKDATGGGAGSQNTTLQPCAEHRVDEPFLGGDSGDGNQTG
jgi:hypothetical protein